MCVSCSACYNKDGHFRDGACPEKCRNKAPPRQWSKLSSVHDLALKTKGFESIDCEEDVVMATNVSSPCHGRTEIVTDEVQALPSYRLGGSRQRALFVAPIDARYTLRPQFDDVGELWVSKDASSDHAELACSGAASHQGRFLHIKGTHKTFNFGEVVALGPNGEKIEPLRAWSSSVRESFFTNGHSGRGENSSMAASKLIDGDGSTSFCPAKEGPSQWVKIEYPPGALDSLTRVMITFPTYWSRYHEQVFATVTLSTDEDLEHKLWSSTLLPDEEMQEKWNTMKSRQAWVVDAPSSIRCAHTFQAKRGEARWVELIQSNDAGGAASNIEVRVEPDAGASSINSRKKDMRYITITNSHTRPYAREMQAVDIHGANIDPIDIQVKSVWGNGKIEHGSHHYKEQLIDGLWEGTSYTSMGCNSYAACREEFARVEYAPGALENLDKVYIRSENGNYKLFNGTITVSSDEDAEDYIWKHVITLEGYNTKGYKFMMYEARFEEVQSGWQTSPMHGASAEFFHIPAASPSVAVATNELWAHCGVANSNCEYNYADDVTPTISSVGPAPSSAVVVPGSDSITITGTGFGEDVDLVDVTLMSDLTPCSVTSVTSTKIICKVGPLTSGGPTTVAVRIDANGYAVADDNANTEVKIDMAITSISPNKGSNIGGTIVTISGHGFAAFGPYNKVTIGDLDCVPRVIRNFECRPTEADRGLNCDQSLAYYKDSIATRQFAQWIDFSNPTSIECQITNTTKKSDAAVDVKVQLITNDFIRNATKLREDIMSVDRNFDCWVLDGCAMRDENYDPIGKFGKDFTYDGIQKTKSNGFSFAAASTPKVNNMSPNSGMVGTEIEFRGEGFDGAEVTDRNYYETKFGFFEQTKNLTIYFKLEFADIECYPQFWNSTYVRCQLFQPLDGAHEMPVHMHIFGKGFASGTEEFSYGVNIVKIESKGRTGKTATGSRLGGDELTLTMSANVINNHPYSNEAEALQLRVFMGVWGENDCHITSIQGKIIKCITAPYVCPQKGCNATVSPTNNKIDRVVPFFYLYFNWEPWYAYGTDTYTFTSELTPAISHSGGSGTLKEGSVVSFTGIDDEFILWDDLSGSDFKVWFGDNLCGSPTFSTETRAATCTVSGPIIPGSYHLNVTICSAEYSCLQASSSDRYYSLHQTVTGISHAQGSIYGGLEVEISGTGFRSDHLSHVKVAGVDCEDVVVASETLIRCTTGSSETARDGNVEVYSHEKGRDGNSVSKSIGSCPFSYSMGATPILDAVVTYGNANGGDTLQLDGSNLKEGESESSITFGVGRLFAVQSSDMIQQTTTRIKGRLPEVPAGHHPISVHVPGLGNSRTRVLKYGVTISSQSRTSYSLYGGPLITITGEGFAPSQGQAGALSGYETKLYYGFSLNNDNTENRFRNMRDLSDLNVVKGPQCPLNREPLCSEHAHYQKYTTLRELHIVSVTYDKIIARVPAHPNHSPGDFTGDRNTTLVVQVVEKSQYVQPSQFWVQTSSEPYEADENGDPLTPSSLRGCFNNAHLPTKGVGCDIKAVNQAIGVNHFDSEYKYDGEAWITYTQDKPFGEFPIRYP